MIERGNHENAATEYAGEDLDAFLARFPLRSRPGIHAPFDQRPIMPEEIERNRRHAGGEIDPEQPSLPIAERSGRQEDQQAKKDDEAERAQQRPSAKVPCRAILHPSLFKPPRPERRRCGLDQPELVAPVPSSARCGLAVVAGGEDQLVMLDSGSRRDATGVMSSQPTGVTRS